MNTFDIISAIISRTPVWVWGLLALLVALGLSYVRTRRFSKARLLIVPIVMMALSVNSLYAAFGGSAAVFAVWLVGLLTTTMLMQSVRQRAHYHSESNSFTVPGSWMPLAVIMMIFCARYVYNVSTAMSPALKTDTMFALGFAAVYGVLSGYFTGRVLSIVRLTKPQAVVASLA